jgi:hypothetical protein
MSQNIPAERVTNARAPRNFRGICREALAMLRLQGGYGAAELLTLLRPQRFLNRFEFLCSHSRSCLA